MKRPFVAVVSAYAIGLLLAGMVQLSPVRLLALAFAFLVPALIFARFRPWLLWPLLVLTGWANLAGRTAVVSPDDLRALLGDETAIVCVRGILRETPHLKISRRDNLPVEHTLAQIQVQALRRGTDWQTAAGTVMVMTPGTLDGRFFAGQPVEISGVMGRPPVPLAEGLFDYREYLATRGIFYQLKAAATNAWQLGALPWPGRR